MTIAQSKLTAQGQISVPAEIRKKLGLRPGSVMEWDESGGEVVVRRAGQYTSAQIHEVLFGTARARKAKADVKEGIRKYIRQRHARD
jgi:AbrB family looped-hinge helix DNA binding protein